MQGRLTEFCILFLCPLDGEQFTLAALIETRESAIAVARNIAKNRFFIIGLLFDRHKIWNFLQKPPFSLRIIDHS